MGTVNDSVCADNVTSEISLWNFSTRVVVDSRLPLAFVSIIEHAQILRILYFCRIESGNLRQSFTNVRQNIVTSILIKPFLGQNLNYCASNAKVEVDIVEVSSRFVFAGIETIVIKASSFYQNFLDVWHFTARFGVIGGSEEV